MRRASPRLILARLAAFGLAVLLAGADAGPSVAQGFFGGLFGGGFGGLGRQAPPPFPGFGRQGDYSYGAPRPRPRHRRVVQAPKEQKEPKEPKDTPAPVTKNASIFVDVIGDSFGQLLANGLDDALSDRPDVGVLHQGRGSSGLVARDYYDWPKTVDELLASKTKIDVAVMMVGSNDRQAIHADGKVYDRGSDDWKRLYAQRVMAIDDAFRKKGIPLIWVGVPITRDSNFADDMAALNDIYRDAAAKTGATYVDTWEAFSDDDGDFDAMGPDINGQTVRLRTSDGIYFTKAGARKLAHFVEAHVRRDLDGKSVGSKSLDSKSLDSKPPDNKGPDSPPPAASASPPATAALTDGGALKSPMAEKPPAIVKPEAGPIQNLDDVPVAANGELTTRSALASASNGAVKGEDVLAKTQVQNAPAGRADDLKWPTGRTPEP